MPGLEDLYREIILDHYRSPRNRGELSVPPARRSEGFNPLCGDEVVLYLDVEGDNVADVKIAGQQGLMFKYSYTDKDGHALSGVAIAVTSPASGLSYAIAAQALTTDFDAQADPFDKMLASFTIE